MTSGIKASKLFLSAVESFRAGKKAETVSFLRSAYLMGYKEDRVDLYRVLVSFYFGDVGELEKLFRVLERVAFKHSKTVVYWGRFLEFAGCRDKAIEKYKWVYKNTFDSVSKVLSARHLLRLKIIKVEDLKKDLPDGVDGFDYEDEYEFERAKAIFSSLVGDKNSLISFYKLLELTPANPEVLVDVVDALMRFGKVKPAYKLALESAEAFGGFEFIYYLARLSEILGDLERAIGYLKKLEKLFPNNPFFPLNIARLMVKKGDRVSALKKLIAMWRTDEFRDMPWVPVWLGHIYSMSGMWSKASKFYKFALNTDLQGELKAESIAGMMLSSVEMGRNFEAFKFFVELKNMGEMFSQEQLKDSLLECVLFKLGGSKRSLGKVFKLSAPLIAFLVGIVTAIFLLV